VYCRTLPHNAAQIRAHCRTRPHRRAHTAVDRLPDGFSLPRTLPQALPHTAACTSAQDSRAHCRTLPYRLPLIAALLDNRTSLLHALKDCNTLLP